MIPADRSCPGATQTASAIEDTGEGVSARERLAELIESADRQMAPEVFADPARAAVVLAEVLLAAGWRAPLPERLVEPFAPDDESPAALTAAYLAHFLGARPARMAAHIARGLDALGLLKTPLPDSETEWGYRFGHSEVVDRMGSEKHARSEALRAVEMTGSKVVVVRREVGPWVEVDRG